MTDSQVDKVGDMNVRIERVSNSIGNLCVDAFHYLALFAIGAAVAWSALHEFLLMVDKGRGSIEDILLLFIYLELGAMVGIYFRTRRMPVRFLIYVAITALTRMMVAYIQLHHEVPDLGIVYISSAILLLAIAALIIRYGSATYPSDGLKDERAGLRD